MRADHTESQIRSYISTADAVFDLPLRKRVEYSYPEKMKTILIFRKPGMDEIEEIRKLNKPDACRIYCLPGLIEPKDFPDYQLMPMPGELIREADRELLSGILEFGDRLAGEESVGELLNLEGLPLWHYQRFRIYFRLQPVFRIRKVVKYFSREDGGVLVYCSFPPAKLQDCISSGTVIRSRNEGVKQKKNYKALINYAIFFILRVLIGFIRPVGSKKRNHLIVDRAFRQNCKHLITLEPKLDNYILSPLFDLSGDDFMILSEVEPPKTSGGSNFRLQMEYFNGQGRGGKTLYGEYILFRGLLSARLYGRRKRLIALMGEALKRIELLGKSGEEKLIYESFLELSRTNAFFITKHLAYCRYFKTHRFATVSSIDENSPATRCILDAARAYGSRIVGIQHGNIGDAQPAYIYTNTDRKNSIMADLTLVWGSYWKHVLVTRGNFSPEAVVVTGQMRTDLIPKLLAKSAEFRAKFTAKPHLAVFASQPMPDKALRWQAAYDVFSAFRDLEDTELVVKLHPAERDSVGYYGEIARKAGLNRVRILYDVDLYELLAACDLLITCYSTVGGEAVYFGKPLIILDHHGDDLLGYHAEGVAWQAKDAGQLKVISEGVLQQNLVPNPEKYREFISRYAYAIDGAATQRTLSTIRAAGDGVSH